MARSTTDAHLSSRDIGSLLTSSAIDSAERTQATIDVSYGPKAAERAGSREAGSGAPATRLKPGRIELLSASHAPIEDAPGAMFPDLRIAVLPAIFPGPASPVMDG